MREDRVRQGIYPCLTPTHHRDKKAQEYKRNYFIAIESYFRSLTEGDYF
jgi:hypothetical protein